MKILIKGIGYIISYDRKLITTKHIEKYVKLNQEYTKIIITNQLNTRQYKKLSSLYIKQWEKEIYNKNNRGIIKKYNLNVYLDIDMKIIK